MPFINQKNSKKFYPIVCTFSSFLDSLARHKIWTPQNLSAPSFPKGGIKIKT